MNLSICYFHINAMFQEHRFVITVVKAACKIRNDPKITLIKINPSEVDDGADPESNIRDACYGKEAKRSR